MATRKKTFHTFREAAKLGPYAEQPLVPDEIDPQLLLSRNTVHQPFYLICEKDCVLAAVSGSGRIAFEGASVNYFPFLYGDFVYVPAGTPHRILPAEESIFYRYKAREAGLEGVAWYCDKCRNPLHRVVWDTAQKLPQLGYLEACDAFNADASLRSCSVCGHVHEPLDLEVFAWKAIAQAELARHA